MKNLPQVCLALIIGSSNYTDYHHIYWLFSSVKTSFVLSSHWMQIQFFSVTSNTLFDSFMPKNLQVDIKL